MRALSEQLRLRYKGDFGHLFSFSDLVIRAG